MLHYMAQNCPQMLNDMGLQFKVRLIQRKLFMAVQSASRLRSLCHDDQRSLGSYLSLYWQSRNSWKKTRKYV